MNQAYQSVLAAGLEKQYRNLEQEIEKDIVRRIQKAGKITDAADWQIQRYMVLGHSTQDVQDIISRAVGGNEAEVARLYAEVIQQEYTRSKALYEQVNANFVPYEQNYELQQLTHALIQQSNDDLYNISKSLGFMVKDTNGRLQFTQLSDVYNDYLDNAITMMASGAYDYNTLIRKVVGEMTASGLRTVDYASGWSNRVDVAVRRALLTGMGQLTGRISDMNGQLLGTEYFEVDWHPGARPEHSVWQGRVWKKEQLYSVCGLGTGPGLLGWNCRHTYYPFIPGVSVRNYSDDWLEQKAREEAEPHSWRGKEYNLYQATQKQRQMETAMRAQREKVQLLQQGNADPDTVTDAKCKYQAQLEEYKAFSKKFNLPEQTERIYYDLRGRVAPSPKVYAQWKAEKVNRAKERAEMKRRADMRKAQKAASQKAAANAKISIHEEYTQHRDVIVQTLHKVETERRTLDHEVGTILDRAGNVINVTGGEAHSVSPPAELLKDNIFTHNHPSGGCFSATDLESMIDQGLLELRASTPQGTYFSLVRNEGTALTDHKFAEEYKKAGGISAAMEAVDADLKAGVITRQEMERRGFQLYVDYMSKASSEWLKENAAKFGYTFTQGVI